MTKTTLGLLRHGQTDWNIDFRLQGITDIPLNETGIAQARDAALALNAADWDIVLTSPLSRAADTAKIVADSFGFDSIAVEQLLLERSFGEAEGLSHEEWKATYSDPNAVPGGESLEALKVRSRELLRHIAEKYEGQRVLAVSHGALIRKLLRIVSNNEFPREGERLGNASLNIFDYDGLQWNMVRYEPRTLHSDLHQPKAQ
ncbi:histidine phosphatase family protein [Rhodoluna sp.]|uniref:histidine phosphatase family protein n=1 Tax=Rhodoluna sp. TaxID=1969481 RepID=UPI0025D8C769|nr:histidine phosphatase family protein [Rhodoluna sp.]